MQIQRNFKGVSNVRPPVNSVVVMPLEAVVNPTLPSDCCLARIRVIKKVIPVPPRALKNKHDY